MKLYGTRWYLTSFADAMLFGSRLSRKSWLRWLGCMITRRHLEDYY